VVAPASGRHYDITGPESLDLATIAASAARQSGTPLEYAGITPSEHWPKMAIVVEDPWWKYAYSTMFASISGQRWGQPPMKSSADRILAHLLLPWKTNGRIAVLRGLTAVLCEARREDAGTWRSARSHCSIGTAYRWPHP
jgi:hypothetical protein